MSRSDLVPENVASLGVERNKRQKRADLSLSIAELVGLLEEKNREIEDLKKDIDKLVKKVCSQKKSLEEKNEKIQQLKNIKGGDRKQVTNKELENRIYSLEKALEIAGAQAFSAMNKLQEFKSEHMNCSKSRGNW